MDLGELDRALAAFATLAPAAFPIHWAQILVLVGEKGQVTYAQVEEELNLSNSSVSRSVHALGEFHRKGGPGLGLLTVTPDPGEGRRYLVRLSARGKALVRQLESI